MIALGKGLATEPYVSSAVLGAHIIDGGTKSTRNADLLNSIAAGNSRVALAHSETSDRFHLTGRRTTTARVNGSEFILNGTKVLSLDAPSADILIISAVPENGDDTSLFLVDRHAPGISMTAYSLIDGSQAADIQLSNVSITSDALIANGPRAISLLEDALDRATVALLSQSVGAMEACLEICSSYLKERKQFGQPIGNFQILQHMAADMLIATHQSRSILYQAIAQIDDEPVARTSAVSAAKIVIGTAMQLVSRNGIQIHGGYGLTDEYAIGHYYRRLLVLEKTYGDIEHHTMRLAEVHNR
jgi:alkylation response protein AidB-like acyl-CoA dehydrogenase